MSRIAVKLARPVIRTRRRGAALWLVAAITGATALVAIPAAAASPTAVASRVSVLHVGLVTEQDVAAQPGSEPDTVVEPDVAVSPLNAKIAVAAAHDGRYPDGGAVGITYAWTHDGGATLAPRTCPGLTTSTGGPEPWVRASDPVVAFGPDGDVYISTLLFAFDLPERGRRLAEHRRRPDVRGAGARSLQRRLRRLRRQEHADHRQQPDQPAPGAALPVLDAVPDRPIRQVRRLAAGARVLR